MSDGIWWRWWWWWGMRRTDGVRSGIDGPVAPWYWIAFRNMRLQWDDSNRMKIRIIAEMSSFRFTS